MEQIYMTELYLEKVRHLKDIRIPISENGLRHLILTGENGSGKTSVLDALSHFINEIATSDRWMRMESALDASMRNEKRARQQKKSENEIYAIEKDVQYFKNVVESIRQGVRPQFNYPLDSFNAKYEKGEYIIAYYKAERAFYAETPKHIEKVELQEHYSALEQPRNDFIKYLRDLSVTEALAFKRGNVEKSRKIKSWFEKFQELLRKIFHDETLRLEFDDDTFSITIYEAGKEPFDFNTLSSGYAAVLDIVADLIIRMEKQTNQTFDFYMPGIVLIDEIETHLHVELQKEIMRLLTTIFPNVQFIVSTHSPFILNSIENAVIYDLEKKILVKDGLADIPYDGIVEGYFSADKLSASLKEKFERYKELIHRNTVTDEELEEITRLEMYLDEIPDYLVLEITTEYQRLKMEFEAREDI